MGFIVLSHNATMHYLIPALIMRNNTLDIKHLEYFLTIVENQFNLSKSAELLYVSQPNLSKFLREFEEEQHVNLFIRKNNRLIALTSQGKLFYNQAKKVVEDYNQMMLDLSITTKSISGTIRIGIPPVILTSLFKDFLPEFILNHPNIKLEVIEAGAYELRKKLLLQQIDIAILISPVSLDSIERKIIFEDTVSIIFSKRHPLALSDEDITFKKLAQQKLVILDNSFALHHNLLRKFSIEGLTPNIFYQSSSWDLLMAFCETTDVVTILPTPIFDYYKSSSCLLSKEFTPSYPWIVESCTLKSSYKTSLVNYVEELITNYFKIQKEAV